MAPEDGLLPKVLMVDPSRCTGCRICELVCSLEKTGEFSPAKALINSVVFPEELVFAP